MRLVASTPNSKPVPEAIRSSLAAISQDDLRVPGRGHEALGPCGSMRPRRRRTNHERD